MFEFLFKIAKHNQTFFATEVLCVCGGECVCICMPVWGLGSADGVMLSSFAALLMKCE